MPYARTRAAHFFLKLFYVANKFLEGLSIRRTGFMGAGETRKQEDLELEFSAFSYLYSW